MNLTKLKGKNIVLRGTEYKVLHLMLLSEGGVFARLEALFGRKVEQERFDSMRPLMLARIRYLERVVAQTNGSLRS